MRQGVEGGAALADVAHPREGVHARPHRSSGEVGARAELAAGAGEHHDPDGRVGSDVAEHLAQLARTSLGFMAFLRAGRSRVMVTMPSSVRASCNVSTDGEPTSPKFRNRLAGLVRCEAWGKLSAMGFDPHRQQVRRKSDYVFVAAAVLVVVVLLLWAFLA